MVYNMWWLATLALTVASVGGLVWYVRTQRHWRHQVKKWPFVVASVILLATFGLQIRWDVGVYQATQTLRVASGNKSATLHCENFFEQAMNLFPNRLGVVWYDNPDRTVIRYHTCNDLIGWHQSSKQSLSQEEGLALHVLLHEAQHIAGTYNETHAECQAMQIFPQVVEDIGGDLVAATSWRDNYATYQHQLLPAQYTQGCGSAPLAKILQPEPLPEPSGIEGSL